jgi:hypothetical protein
MQSSGNSDFDLTGTLGPYVSNADDWAVASAVLKTVVDCTLALTDELTAVANAHFDAAPAGSVHVLKLNSAISRAVLEWIERWPR